MSELQRVLRAVVHKDSGPFRQQAFAYLASRKPAARAARGLHRRLPRPLARRLIEGYGWASALSTAVPRGPAELLVGAAYRNERRQVDALREDLPELRFAALELGAEVALRPQSWLDTARLLARSEARAQLRAACAPHDDFLVACRVAETVGRWLRIRGALGATGASAVLVSSDTNPYACALIAAAREVGMKVAYVTHGHLPDGPPPLDVDLAIFDGQALLDVYRAAGPVRGEVVFRGTEGRYRPMRTAGLAQRPTVGVFASLLVDWRRLGALIPRLRAALRAERIVLRLHPNQSIRDPRWRDHVPLEPQDLVSDGACVLLDDAARCDLVVAGNSSCHLTVLKFGVPTLFLPGLDEVPHDFYRMLERRVVAEARAPEDIEPAALAAFYDDPAWAGRYQAFDASYPGRDAACRAEVADAMRALVRGPE